MLSSYTHYVDMKSMQSELAMCSPQNNRDSKKTSSYILCIPNQSGLGEDRSNASIDKTNDS